MRGIDVFWPRGSWSRGSWSVGMRGASHEVKRSDHENDLILGAILVYIFRVPIARGALRGLVFLGVHVGPKLAAFVAKEEEEKEVEGADAEE